MKESKPDLLFALKEYETKVFAAISDASFESHISSAVVKIWNDFDLE